MRCTTCHRVIWPWQHFAMRALGGGRVDRAHVTCGLTPLRIPRPLIRADA